jgi:hypothetical protein
MTDDSTKIKLAMETNPRNLFKPNDASAVKKFKKQYKENLAILKSVLEAHQVVKV